MRLKLGTNFGISDYWARIGKWPLLRTGNMITNDLGQVVGENLLPPTHSPLGGKWDRYTTNRTTTQISNISMVHYT